MTPHAADPQFETIEEAYSWMSAEVDDPCEDNHREALADDQDAVRKYENQRRSGCCGSFDAEVVVGGKRYLIGCNYGH